MSICIIIPALNEEAAIGSVVRSVRDQIDRVIVVDNGSTDATAAEAAAAGADVVHQAKKGYGRSCLTGITAAGDAEILVFMDGDGADDPADLHKILAPIIAGEADFVVGSRLTGARERGALTLPQQFGNALACFLMRRLWASAFTDLGPFRAIKRQTLDALDVTAETYGWTVEMQARAVKRGVRYREIPVSYRKRAGVSKISGTVRGVILAGAHILGVIAREAVSKTPQPENPAAHGRKNVTDGQP